MTEKNIEKRVKELEKRLEEVEDVVFSQEEDTSELSQKSKKDKLGIIAEKTDLDIDVIEEVYEFDSGMPFIILPLNSSKKGCQRKITLLTLTAKYLISDERKISASKLTKLMKEEYSVYTTTISPNLQSYENYIRKEGSKGGENEINYKITRPGVRRGKELIKEVADEGEI